MKRILTLVRVMAKASSENILKGKKAKVKTSSKVGMLLIYALLAVYVIGFVGFFSYMLINTLATIGQEGLSFQLLFLVLNGLIIFSALIVTPTVLYFSKDIEHYIVMPLKPWEIMISKFLTSLLFSYATTLAIMIPFIGVYFYLIGFSFTTLLLYVITFLLIPIFPSAIITILVIIVFTFAPFVRNKDAFTYFTMFITIIISLSFSFSTSFETMDANTIVNLVNGGDNSLLSLIQSPYNPSTQFARAIINNDIIALFKGFVVAAGFLLILGFIGQALYFKGAIGISEMSSKKKALSAKETHKLSKVKSQTLALAIHDGKRIFRTPILLTNYYFGVILLPIMLAIPLIIESDMDQIMEVIASIRSFIVSLDSLFMVKLVVLVGLVFGYGLTTFSSLAATSFSREGDNMQTLKSMPIEMKTIYHSKLLISTATLSLIPMLFAGALSVFLNINIVLILIMLVMIILGSLLSSLIGCIFDIIAPKLVWETEQQAVKQNFVSMIAMFVQMGIIGLIVYVFFKLSFDAAFYTIVVASGIICFIIYFASLKLINTVLAQKVETM